MKTRSTLAIVAALMLTLTNCSAPDPTEQFVGTWGITENNEPNLTIDSDLNITGSDGCNSLSGTGSVQGDTIEFNHLASTKMACPDITTWLSAAQSATVSDGVMFVTGSDAEQIGTLNKVN